MRAVATALVLALTGSAGAQTPPEASPSPEVSPSPANPPAVADGSAVLSPEAGKLVQAMLDAGGLTKAGMRGVFAQLIVEGVKPPNRDFAAELEAGKAFKLTYSGKTVDVAAAPADVAAMGGLLNNLPNLYTLWDTPEHTEQFVEISRWGDRMESRIILFIGNTLDDAYQNSAITNGYAPYVGTLSNMWNALKAMELHDSRERGYALFSAGLGYSLDKQKKAGRKSTEPFLWEWTQSPESKASLVR